MVCNNPIKKEVDIITHDSNKVKNVVEDTAEEEETNKGAHSDKEKTSKDNEKTNNMECDDTKSKQQTKGRRQQQQPNTKEGTNATAKDNKPKEVGNNICPNTKAGTNATSISIR
ncbi:unnamed protein product [Linum trigynum]|uniref:Uncharacterized protein n=1 Tax=Linum trigynum TaxID=586398 RepID=A0AAV2CID8_9ROSI